jgi:hypothetical protein
MLTQSNARYTQISGNIAFERPIPQKLFIRIKRVMSGATVRWGDELLKAIEWIKGNPDQVQQPLLMMHAEADELNLPSGSKNFAASVDDCVRELSTWQCELK